MPYESFPTSISTMLCVVKRACAAAVKNRVGFGSTNKPEERYNLIDSAIKKSIPSCFVDTFTVSTDIVTDAILSTIHSKRYIDFLKLAHPSLVRFKDAAWTAEDGALVPNHVTRIIPPEFVSMHRQSGYFCGDTMTPIYEDTFSSALVSAKQASMAAFYACYRLGKSTTSYYRAAYAMVDSPGHHAKYDQANGYCFFNNAVIAAEQMKACLGEGSRVAILDLDFHAGNGTAEIVSNSKLGFTNLMAVSIHTNPAYDYPSFEGFESENTDKVLNIVLPAGADYYAYEIALQRALHAIVNFKADGLVIAFGGDTFKDDPDAIAKFSLELDDYQKMSASIVEALGPIPIVITQEGGYNMDHIGTIVTNFLSGFIPL